MIRKRILVWFRRDLRVTDHTALAHALSEDAEIVPVFVLNDDILAASGTPLTCFFMESLKALRGNLAHLGAGLVVRRGDFTSELLKLADEIQADALFFNRDYEPEAVVRDQAVAEAFLHSGRHVESFKDQVIFEADEVLSDAGQPYKVFTPYKNKWLSKINQISPVLSRPKKIPVPQKFGDIPSVDLPSVDTSGYTFLVDAGEKAAWQTMNLFMSNAIRHYHSQRNTPSIRGTSMLSAHLRAGTISIRAVYHEAMQAKARIESGENTGENIGEKSPQEQIDVFISELIWRDFYQQILVHFPHVVSDNFLRQYDALEWRSAPDEFDKWREGQTGYPIVDAAMRQLRQHGWMHNRLRMIVAMFLTKHLLLDWRLGEAHFAQHLVDYDLAANNGGWQWSASTGTDAQPYFRIFNPIEQARNFDGSGLFIAQYCPELKNVPLKYLFSPWEMSVEMQQKIGCIIGKHYPAPIVEHKYARNRALEAFKKANEQHKII